MEKKAQPDRVVHNEVSVLTLRNISKRWTLTIPNWHEALNHFTIRFAKRMLNNL